jgi:hypothetical protein
MKFHLWLALAVLFQVPGNPAAPQQGKATIEGTVTNSTSGEPLDRAQVTLQRMNAPPAPAAAGQPAVTGVPLPQAAPVLTESDGKFKFEVEPGQYRLRVQRNGFAAQEYGQRAVGSSGTIMNLVPGQAMKDISLKMIAAGVVTGRVRDIRGEPIAGVQVSLIRSVYSVTGQRSLTTSGGGTTDDRGEYRIFFIPAGRYILSVGSTSSAITALVFNSSIVADRTFPTTYYPGTTDPSRAVTLDVQPGRELTGIDFVVSPPPTYRVRGRVIDGATGQAPRTASVSLLPRSETEGGVLGNAAIGITSYNANGTFEIRNVIPGSYWLRAMASANLQDPINPSVVANVRTASELLDTVIGTRSAAQIPIDVTGGDLSDLTLTMTLGVTVPMQLIVEGQELMTIPGYENIRASFRPTSLGLPNPLQRSSFAGDGTATLSNVPVGEYRVQVSVPASDLYLKEARFDRTDILNDPWQVTSRTSGTLTLVLSPKGGQVQGDLTDALSQPVTGNQVLLIPDQNRDRPELYKTAITDANGHFTFRGIPPGGYKVFSWEAIEPNAWYDRELLSRYEQQARPIRIQEGSKETIDLKIISAPK